jgi:hypothetical protein
MIQRCTQVTHEQYANYGGRGITVCEAWRDFKNFLADMGERPYRKTLDRIDPNGNYEPSNCKWSTAKQQAKNKRKNAKVLPEKADKDSREVTYDSTQNQESDGAREEGDRL